LATGDRVLGDAHAKVESLLARRQTIADDLADMIAALERG
jgi:hypothetical protein